MDDYIIERPERVTALVTVYRMTLSTANAHCRFKASYQQTPVASATVVVMDIDHDLMCPFVVRRTPHQGAFDLKAYHFPRGRAMTVPNTLQGVVQGP